MRRWFDIDVPNRDLFFAMSRTGKLSLTYYFWRPKNRNWPVTKEVYYFSLWPPKQWKKGENGTFTGCKFILNVSRILAIGKSLQTESKKESAIRELIEIASSSNSHKDWEDSLQLDFMRLFGSPQIDIIELPPDSDFIKWGTIWPIKRFSNMIFHHKFRKRILSNKETILSEINKIPSDVKKVINKYKSLSGKATHFCWKVPEAIPILLDCDKMSGESLIWKFAQKYWAYIPNNKNQLRRNHLVKEYRAILSGGFESINLVAVLSNRGKSEWPIMRRKEDVKKSKM